MADIEIKTKLKESILSFANGDLAENGIKLFKTLGYVTDRQARLDSPNYETFRDSYIYEISKFNEEKALVSQWKYVDILFQLSREEVLKQMSLFDTKQVDRTIIETYLFITIELAQNEYPRTELSQITREVNRIFPMPVLILFKHGQALTLSVINRRLHKRDDSKDVLEKVTQIKDINILNPHRAHIEILFDLSFDELNYTYKFTNFVELHNAWQKTLDTKELNKRFYNELFNWYLWAVRSVKFPNDVDDDKDDTVYNSESVIRLLTRLIFVWFIKEKGLVPDNLFDEKEMKRVLKDFNPNSIDNSIYYRAILQNLFFATLNTPMDKDVDKPEDKRRFINTLPKTNNDQYLDQTKYRYQNYFNKPDEAIAMFASIPFLNGGLFECLDFKEGKKEIRYDGFSSTDGRQAFVPDKLFFAPEFMHDLNSDYGTKGKSYKVEGLLNILNSYKFTITENTPLDEEIALDPELLGKVFENLLASYNPETQTTARKQTGSFYTPREIVHYMVDESLIAYLKQKIGETTENEEKLRQLFAYTDTQHPFTETEADILVNALSDAKILDPACGSGAFPMGVLQRMVDLLAKLDADNERWKELQRKRAIAETTEIYKSNDNTEERRFRLNEIDKAFDLNMNFPGYARKLFLIENCIYGVDIQQIAIQISKLRFFISLIVDQKVDDAKPNRNILSMPNLETKFVAANTLIGLDKPKQLTLMADEVKQLEKELIGIRHKIFFTRKYYDKKELKKKDKAKREELQAALERSGYTKNTAAQMAGWNPFDPMVSATFFDSETMFGFTEGFDIVIGNPPFVVDKNLTSTTKKYYLTNYKSSLYQINLYLLFIEKALNISKLGGSTCFIVPNTWLINKSVAAFRSYFIENFEIKSISDLTKINVFEATVLPVIFFASNHKIKEPYVIKILEYFDGIFLPKLEINTKNIISDKDYLINYQLNPDLQKILNTIEDNSFPLTKIAHVSFGVKFYQVNKGNPKQTREIVENHLYTHDKRINETCKKILEGKDVERYSFTFGGKWIEYGEWLAEPRKPELFEGQRILLRRIVGKGYLISTVVEGDYCNNSLLHTIKLKNEEFKTKYILSLLNSRLMGSYFIMRYARDEKTFPEIRVHELESLPIKSTKYQEVFCTVVDYLLMLITKQNFSFFERLIDAMVYELYFPLEIKAANCEVLKYLSHLTQLKEGSDESTINTNLQLIEKVQNELSDPKHLVSKAMDKMEGIEEIRIIEGKK